MGDPRLDASGTITVDRFALGGAIQPLLQFGKMLGRFVFFPRGNQVHHFPLGVPGGLQKSAVDLAFPQCGTGLFGGRGGVGHKQKQCPRSTAPVNP